MNPPNDLDKTYEGYFKRQEGGKYFMEQLANLIVDNYTKAENNPTLSRDYVQRAKGVRDVMDHIHSVIGGVAKQ